MYVFVDEEDRAAGVPRNVRGSSGAVTCRPPAGFIMPIPLTWSDSI